ncbi:MAG: hypothetical protein L6254_04990 [Candidatus Omnitrophica bacterium]|nr:hypothetical protein [Candidatus Omnitrophota bacterium]
MAKKEFTYYACPFCSWHRMVKGDLHFDRIDPSEVKIISVRVFTGGITGAKRGGSMKTISVTKLGQLPEKYKQQIINQARKILAVLGE